MVSLEEIRNWADVIAAESTLKLIKFCHKPSKRAGQTVTQIVLGEDGNDYRVWIFPEFNIILTSSAKE
jgi:hypothetical protein